MAVHVSDRPRAGPMLPVLIGAPAATSKAVFAVGKVDGHGPGIAFNTVHHHASATRR